MILLFYCIKQIITPLINKHKSQLVDILSLLLVGVHETMLCYVVMKTFCLHALSIAVKK